MTRPDPVTHAALVEAGFAPLDEYVEQNLPDWTSGVCAEVHAPTQTQQELSRCTTSLTSAGRQTPPLF